jgi:hypothetical protein
MAAFLTTRYCGNIILYILTSKCGCVPSEVGLRLVLADNSDKAARAVMARGLQEPGGFVVLQDLLTARTSETQKIVGFMANVANEYGAVPTAIKLFRQADA